MIRVQKGAPAAASQAIEDRLASIEAKVDTLAELMAQAMIADPRQDEGDEIPSLYAERDQTQPL
jgi:hypothetical protein